MDRVQTRPMSVLFYRVVWLLLGPFTLFVVTVGIVQTGGGWFTVRDLVFGAILIGTILSRWGDYWKGERTDSYGEPVTVADIRRYTIIALVAGAVIWAGANLVGTYIAFG